MSDVKTREARAFIRGFDYGVEQAINAHDDLIGAVILLMGALRFGPANLVLDSDGDPRYLDDDEVLVIADRRVSAAMAAVRRVREQGALAWLPLYELEVSP
jgi:hypothetical protein